LAAAWVLVMTKDTGEKGRVHKEGIKMGVGREEKKEL
jgi:hypothetical protein